jgi:hypothetical protein
MLTTIFRIAPRIAVRTARYNSTSTSSRASRMVEMARQVEKPNLLDSSIPLLWATCGVLTYTAWNRQEGRRGEEVDKLIII